MLYSQGSAIVSGVALVWLTATPKGNRAIINGISCAFPALTSPNMKENHNRCDLQQNFIHISCLQCFSDEQRNHTNQCDVD